MVVFHILARPALRKMMGYATWDAPVIQAILEEPIHNEDGRRVYARAYVTKEGDGEYHARLSGPQGSNILTAMARANGLAICPEDVTELPVGALVRVEMLAEIEGA
jgi:molybdopterin molybdotransferase